VVRGSGVAVTEHRDHEYVPGELQREVGADEHVTAGGLTAARTASKWKTPITSATASGKFWLRAPDARSRSSPAGVFRHQPGQHRQGALLPAVTGQSGE
jgi:hypothetical protein